MAWSPWLHKAYAAYQDDEKKRHTRLAGGYTFTNAEAAALVARFTTPPTNARKALIDNLIGSLKTAGVWSKLDALYLVAAADNQAARRNWVQDLYNLGAVASPTFTVDRGYTGDGAASYLSTGINITTGGIKFTQNDNHLSVWSRTAAGGTAQTEIGFVEGFIRGFETAGGATRNSNGSSVEGFASASGQAFFANSRIDAAGYSVYRDGVATAHVRTTAALSNRTILIGARGATVIDGFSSKQLAAASVGSGLSAQNVADLRSALNTYLTAVGAV
jgi:hypothetical protein